MTNAFVYRWTEMATGKWYVGSRTAKNCHQGDGYICSSRTVKPMILANPIGWSRSILATGSPTYMRALESRYLRFIKAHKNPMSFNLHVGDGRFTTAGKPISASHKQAISKALIGGKRSNETRKLMSEKASGTSNPFYGRVHSADTRMALSAFHTGDDNASKRPEVRAKLAALGRLRDVSHLHTPESMMKRVESARKAGAEGRMTRTPLYGDDNPSRRPEVRAKISAALMGRTTGMHGKTHSAETKAKMADSRRAYWAARRMEAY